MGGFVRLVIALLAADAAPDGRPAPVGLGPDTDLRVDLGMSSLVLVELACLLEEELGIGEVRVEGLDGKITVGAVETRVLELVAQQDPADADELGRAMDRVRASLGVPEAGPVVS